jgi:hypothetical protein
MNAIFFPSTLPANTAQLVEKINSTRPEFLKSFYLSGGTGLSLQIGHRESEDLDFFCSETFNALHLEKEIAALGQLTNTELAAGTLNTYVDGVKLQFLEYQYPLLEPFSNWQGMQLSSILDIACTKLQTVSMRGSKKDFVDLYFLLDIYSLPELLEKAKSKYSAVDYNQAHILKSLVYFEDADAQPMPRMIKDVNWDVIKSRMITEVKNITF